MSIKGNIDDLVGKETLVAGRTLDNYCTDSGCGAKMDEADKPCTDSDQLGADDSDSVTIGVLAAGVSAVIGQKVEETSATTIPTVAQTTAETIGQCKTATAEIDTRELIHKETGCGNHAELTDVCNNTDVLENEGNKVTLQESLYVDVDTETKEKKETSTVNASTSEIDLTKEDAAEIADVENSSTSKNAWITDGGKAVKLAPANKELMSVMTAKESDDKAVHSVVEKLLSAVTTDRVDNNSKKILETSENVVKKKDDEKGILLDQQKSVPSAPTSDALSKTSSSKFTCIGPAQLVARKVASHAKSGPSTAPSSSEFKQAKRTEKFIVKNVSKVSKMYKVSNLSYKIKPVRKNLGSNPTYPVIYVGEPAFMEDFFGGSINVGTPPTEIKESDLYDISKLQNAFTPTENRSALNTTPSIGKPYLYSDMPHPSLNSRPRFVPPCPALNQLFMPPASLNYSGISNLKPGGVIRIVARTIPSATIASHTTTSTSARSLCTQKQTYQAIKPIHLATVGGFPSQPHKTRPVIFQTHATPASVAQQHTGQAPVTKILSPQIKVVRNTSAVNRGVMSLTVNLLPGTNTTITKTETSKIQQPVKFLQSSSSVLSKLANSLTVTTGKMKTPASLVIIPSKKNANVCPVVQGSTVAQERKATKFSNNLAKIASTHTENNITLSMPKPVAKIMGNFKAECGPNADEQLSTVNSPITTSSKSLREGVEVVFEDGVRHFITSLKQMTHQDDEPIKSWSDLKKGAEVAAKWVDGQIYDATVVACYFPAEKKLQPVVQLEKLKEKSQKITPKVQKRKENYSSIRCTKCRSVFKSLVHFRKHLKTTCKNPDIVVPKSAMVVTDGTVEVVGKGEKCRSPGIIVPKSAMLVTDGTVEAVSKGETSASRKKLESPSSETKKSNKHSRKRVMKEPEKDEKPPLKKRKITPVEKPVLNKAEDDDAIFKTGTKFLHRWQLDDGTSKWYQGEVIRIVSKDKAFLDREFEISYKGESENYFLKLYEDYPADIRIMGKI